MIFYTLEGKKIVKVSSLNIEEMKSIQDPKNRVVRQTHFEDGSWLSTVFLMIDHGFEDGEEPILFETMLFGIGDSDEVLERYHTWDEAEKGHIKFVKMLVEDGAVVAKDEAKKNSIEDELEEIDRFELMDFDE